MHTTLLTMVSYGTVAANKPLTTKDIEVTPMEQLTMVNGELTDNLSSANVKGQDADGGSYETTVHTAATVTATWLPFGSNRKTPPDVRRGEKVCIWKYADADKYYWSELEYNGKLRKLETVVFMISNTKNENEEATLENTYFFEWSTHNKIIHMHTGTSDGEPFGFDFLLNTRDGNFQITDTVENTIFLDSPSKRIVLKNAEGTFIDLNAADLFINVVGDMVTQVGGNMRTMVKGEKTTSVGGGYLNKVEGGYSVEASSADFITPMLTASEKLTTGKDAVIGGSLKLAKGMSTGAMGGGDISLNGNIVGSGSASFTGSVSAPNIR